MNLALYTFLGAGAAGALALFLLSKAVNDERWPASHMFRYQVLWSLGTLTFIGALAGYCIGTIFLR